MYANTVAPGTSRRRTRTARDVVVVDLVLRLGRRVARLDVVHGDPLLLLVRRIDPIRGRVTSKVPPNRPEATDVRARHRRHRPQPDRSGEQGVARRPATRRPRRTIVQAVLDKVPELDPGEVDDLILGCGQPAGEQGFNVGRSSAMLAGLEDVPGVTVNRYCSSSLQTIRMAAHAIKAGEGDVFVAGGVETSAASARASPTAARHAQREVRRRRVSHPRSAPRAARPWAPLDWLPDVYIAMGQTAENVAEHEKVPAASDGRVRRALSQQRAVQAQENGFFEREITPVTLPDGTVVSKDDGPRPGTTVEKLAR